MRIGKKAILLFLISFGLVFISAAVGPAFNAKYVQAASKPKLNKSSMTIPVGKIKKGVWWYKDGIDYDEAEALTVKNKQKGASYTFASSNTKVVKISKNGGYLTGVSKGTATITCKQTYKNKTTVVGTCKVTVKDASVIDKGADLTIGSDLMNVDYFDGFEGFSVPLPFDISYMNPDAAYTIKSDSKDFVLEETTLTDEEKKVYSSEKPYRYKAKKAGKYTLSVIEKYNKKSRTIGKFTVEVHDVEISDRIYEIYVNDYIGAFWPVSYSRTDKYYYFAIDGYDESNPDKNIIQMNKDEYGNLIIQGLNPGTARVKVYEDSIENGRYLGYYTVKVNELPDTSTSSQENIYISGENSSNSDENASSSEVNSCDSEGDKPEPEEPAEDYYGVFN